MIKSIKIKGVPVRFDDSGSGEVLVFLHGYLESIEIWEAFTRPLETDYRIIRIDLPGHGETGIFGPVSGMETMAEAVKGVLDHLQIGRAFIAGHSMGGYTALAALEYFPEIFKAICLFHSHTLADSDEVRAKREREAGLVGKGLLRLLVSQNIPNMYATRNLDQHKDAVEFSMKIARGLSEEGVIAAIHGLKERPDRSGILSGAKVPCLNIIGMLDNYIPFEDVSMKTVLPPGSSRLILEGSGHMGFIEEPEKCRNGIIQFLNNIG